MKHWIIVTFWECTIRNGKIKQTIELDLGKKVWVKNKPTKTLTTIHFLKLYGGIFGGWSLYQTCPVPVSVCIPFALCLFKIHFHYSFGFSMEQVFQFLMHTSFIAILTPNRSSDLVLIYKGPKGNGHNPINAQEHIK